MKSTRASLWHSYNKTKTKRVASVLRFTKRNGSEEFGRSRYVYAFTDVEPISRVAQALVIRLLWAAVPLDRDVKPVTLCRYRDGSIRVSLPYSAYEPLPSGMWKGTYRKEATYVNGSSDWIVTLQRVVPIPVGAEVSGCRESVAPR